MKTVKKLRDKRHKCMLTSRRDRIIARLFYGGIVIVIVTIDILAITLTSKF